MKMTMEEYAHYERQRRAESVKFTAEMNRELQDQIIVAAAKQNLSPSAFVRLACRDRIAWVMVPEIQQTRKTNPLARAFKKIADMLA